MKSRTLLAILFIAAVFVFVAFPAHSGAVTFPVTYEGALHVTAFIPYAGGGCEGDSKMKITLYPNGTLKATKVFMVSTPGPNKTACQIISDDSLTYDGTHDMAGKFSVEIPFGIDVAGTFDDDKITGSGSGSTGSIELTLSFTLPKSYNCSADKKIPLPVGQQVFADEAPASPVIGVVPSAIKPLGLGDIVNDKTSSTFKVQFCTFEGPVDIYLIYGDAAFQFYVLGSDGTVKGAEHFQAWKTGVTGPVNETIDSSFGGLFPDPGRLPKGMNTFFVLVVPTGNAASGLYLWILNADKDCENIYADLPQGPNFFLQEPIAVPVFSSDPVKMKPLAIGPVAVGGKTVAMYTEFCSFGPKVHIYYGLFCDDDLENLYLLNFAGKEDREQAAKNEILEKVPLASFAGFSKPFESYAPDNQQSEITSFFLGSSQDVPKGQCIYFVAVTAEDEPQPASKYYMWGTLVEFNIRNALIDYWWNGLHPAAGVRTEVFQKNVTEKIRTLIQNKK